MKHHRTPLLARPRPLPTVEELAEWHGRVEVHVEHLLRGLEDLDVDRYRFERFWCGRDRDALANQEVW